MENLEKELEKLFCYCMGKEEIEVRDIEAICTTQITNKIFEMVEAVAVRNQKKALDYYYDLLALKEPPMRILYLLTRQFKLLLEVKDLAGKRYDKAAIAKKDSRTASVCCRKIYAAMPDIRKERTEKYFGRCSRYGRDGQDRPLK